VDGRLVALVSSMAQVPKRGLKNTEQFCLAVAVGHGMRNIAALVTLM
jgi:hypothetical protein